MTSPAPTTVALYVSGHGYGHAVRAAEVAGALLAQGCRVLVRTDAPTRLFPAGVVVLPSPGWPVDVGVVQRDGLEMDLPATRTAWDDFGPRLDEHAVEEARLLREHGARVVMGDMPPLAFLAARVAGLPSVAVTNFAWDWIYAIWPDFERAIHWVQHGFQAADVLLRLPLHATDADAFPSFQRIEDVPLIARTASVPRRQMRAALGLRIDDRVVLLSFGGFHASALNLAALGKLSDVRFVLTPPIRFDQQQLPENVTVLAREQRDYVSLLAACDAVVTKPGYGIVADCLANRVPVLYTDRGPFREYDVLVKALDTLGRARYVSQAALAAGDLGEPLSDLFASRQPWAALELDGAQVVARRLLALAHAGTRGG